MFQVFDVAESMFVQVTKAVKAGTIISLVLVTILFVGITISMLLDFSDRIQMLRKGIYNFDLEKIGGIAPSTTFVGLHISNSIIAYAFSWVFYSIMFTIVCLPFTYQLLCYYKYTIITIIVS